MEKKLLEFKRQVSLTALVFTFVMILPFSFLLQDIQAQSLHPSEYVNPLIGTASMTDAKYLGNNPASGEELYYGCVIPGAMAPDALVKLSPISGWQGCCFHVRGSGYKHSDSLILGFTHRNHEYNRFGNILFMPTVGLIRTTPVNEFNRKEDYSSFKDFKSEKASAGYYTVFLTDCGVKVELTATRNCGFHRYTFPKSNQVNIQIDLAIAAEMEKWQMSEINGNYTVKLVPQPPPVQNAGIQILDNRRIAGWQLPNNSDTVFFYAEFSKPFISSGTWENDLVKANSILGNGYPIGGYVTFTTSENEEILVKVGISSYGIDDARTKLKQEIPGMDFDVTRKETGQKWDNILTKIEVTVEKPPV